MECINANTWTGSVWVESLGKRSWSLFGHRLTVPGPVPFFLTRKNKNGPAVTRAAHSSVGCEDMPWLCLLSTEHHNMQLLTCRRMLAAEIVSTCPSHIPRWPLSFLGLVRSRQSFISSVSGSLSSGQIWDWRLFKAPSDFTIRFYFILFYIETVWLHVIKYPLERHALNNPGYFFHMEYRELCLLN